MAAENGVELARAYVTIIPSFQGAQQAITDGLVGPTEGAGDEAGTRAGGRFREKFTAAAGLAAKAAAASIAAVGAAVAMVVKGAIDAYGDFEQLSGGLELALGDAYGFVEERASQAFRSVQLSQNEYLRQVNGLAVGLRESMGGNAQAAAELADRVVTAEADIVSATGASQEAVQNAFNGIMKSNFSMLDNLQLGITPTKEGFQEVIDKVNAWREAQGLAGDLTIDSLADCQTALVDYVEMMGYSGYAAAEAAGTIQGSLAMVQASWTDFLTSLGDEDGDVTTAVSNLVESITAAAGNIIPRVVQIVSALAEALPAMITQLVPVIVDQMPAIFDAANKLFSGLLSAVPVLMDELLRMLPMVIDGVCDFLVGNIDVLLDAAIALFFGILDAIPVIVSALAPRLPEIVYTITRSLVEHIPDILAASVDLFRQVLVALTDVVDAIPGMAFELVRGFIDGLWGMAGALWDAVQGLFGGVVDWVRGIFGINSPSKEFRLIAAYDVQGFTDELDRSRAEIRDTVESTFSLGGMGAYKQPAYAGAIGGTVYNVSFGGLSMGVDGSTTLDELVAGAQRYQRMGALV